MRRAELWVGTALCAVGASACARWEADDVSASVETTPPGCEEPPQPPPFGANCGEDWECAPNPCVDYHCSVYCDPLEASACRGVGGLCALLRPGRHGCTGELERGVDADDAVLRPGDTAARTLATAADRDVFRLDVGVGTWEVVVRPAADVDVALDFYDARGLRIQAFDDGYAGVPEAASWTTSDVHGGFVVVRQVGTATGDYAVSLAGEAVIP